MNDNLQEMIARLESLYPMLLSSELHARLKARVLSNVIEINELRRDVKTLREQKASGLHPRQQTYMATKDKVVEQIKAEAKRHKDNHAEAVAMTLETLTTLKDLIREQFADTLLCDEMLDIMIEIRALENSL